VDAENVLSRAGRCSCLGGVVCRQKGLPSALAGCGGAMGTSVPNGSDGSSTVSVCRHGGAWCNARRVRSSRSTSSARRAILACRACANCPSSQFVADLSLAASGKSHPHFRASRLAEEGRFAIVTSVEPGKRWARCSAAWCHSRADERSDATAKSCGPGTPVLMPSRR